MIMVLVFGAFVLGGERVIELFGIGLASAVLLDALLVRSALVPAVMILFGKRNWWLPAWLERILPHMRIEGSAGRAAAEERAAIDSAPVPEPERGAGTKLSRSGPAPATPGQKVPLAVAF